MCVCVCARAHSVCLFKEVNLDISIYPSELQQEYGEEKAKEWTVETQLFSTA